MWEWSPVRFRVGPRQNIRAALNFFLFFSLCSGLDHSEVRRGNTEMTFFMKKAREQYLYIPSWLEQRLTGSFESHFYDHICVCNLLYVLNKYLNIRISEFQELTIEGDGYFTSINQRCRIDENVR